MNKNLEEARKELEKLHPDMPEVEYFALWQDLRLSALESAIMSIEGMSPEKYDDILARTIKQHIELRNFYKSF